MDKEKEIQEMADIAEIYCSNHFDEKICNNEDDCNKCTFYALAEAGYRKADEVRKETAKEILQEVGEYMSGYIWFKELCEKYGVEVDE
ncbi:MAG: hypothetical protein LUD19_01270 [Clostridia bacterium]|nr:hypothetical protein [Clostridia bacterium]